MASTAQPLQDQDIAGASAAAMAVATVAGPLGQALSAFGQPSEWWHDSIILGRLSALALRYFAARATRRPWQAWQAFVLSAQGKQQAQLRCRKRLALRSWRWRSLARGKRLQHKLPLVRVVAQLPCAALRLAWARLRQATFQRRDVERRLRLLRLVERKMLDSIAHAHYYRSLLRLGIAGFWLATQIPRLSSRWVPAAVAAGAAVEAAPLSHVQRVVCRVWRRWCFATRLWLSSAEYRERETEAWLAGECSTPRSIATSSALQAQGWGARASKSPDFAMSIALSPVVGVELERSPLVDEPAGLLLDGRPLDLEASFPSPRKAEDGAEWQDRPQRSRPYAARQQQRAVEESLRGSPPRKGLAAEAPDRLRSSRLPAQAEPRRVRPAKLPREAPEVPQARAWRPAEGGPRRRYQSSAVASDLEVTFVEPDGRGGAADGPGVEAGELLTAAGAFRGGAVGAGSSATQADGDCDYWAMRCRIATASAGRRVLLRQRC